MIPYEFCSFIPLACAPGLPGLDNTQQPAPRLRNAATRTPSYREPSAKERAKSRRESCRYFRPVLGTAGLFCPVTPLPAARGKQCALVWTVTLCCPLAPLGVVTIHRGVSDGVDHLASP